jgi:Hydrolase of X-linked nucleoside diphosphate N terminal/NUDIX domain
MPGSRASRDHEQPSAPQWLRWSRRLQAIAQDGLTYSRDDYDLERYEQLREPAAEIFAAYSTGTLEEDSGLLALETGPATPKVDVRAAVFRRGRILLVKEPDGWSLPGGWADVGESPSEAAARETLEAFLERSCGRFTSRAVGTIYSPCPRERKGGSGGEKVAGRAGCATGCATGPA